MRSEPGPPSRLQDCFLLQGLWEWQVELWDACRCRSNRRHKVPWVERRCYQCSIRKPMGGWGGHNHYRTSSTFLIQADSEVGLLTIWWDLKSWHLKRIKQHPHTTLVLPVSSCGIWKQHALTVVAESPDSELACSVLVLAPGSPTPRYCSFSHRSKTYVPLNAHLFSYLLTGTGKWWDGRNGEQMSNSREGGLISSQTRNQMEFKEEAKTWITASQGL